MTSSLRRRFGTTSRNAQWSTGNGNPDAECFSVDRAGVLVAGVGLYGGGGDYELEMELLDEVSLFNNFCVSFSLNQSPMHCTYCTYVNCKEISI